MVDYLGRYYTRADFLRYVGDVSQIGGARPCVLTNGRAKDVECVDFTTGTGLQFTVLPGRALDIAQLRYRGIAISWISKNGIVSPHYYEEPGINWLRTYFGGFLTTCGLTYMGAPCKDGGVELGLHGRISNIVAENLCLRNFWDGNEFIMMISGEMKETRVFAENLHLIRTIETKIGSNSFKIRDRVINYGFEPQPLMILYHCNFGFPLLSNTSKLHAPFLETEPRDEEARRGLDNFMQFDDPIPNYKEQVFLHKLKGDGDGNTLVVLENPRLEYGFGICMQFNVDQLPFFTEWKQMGESEYVVGLEPGTAYPLGRAKVRSRGELMMIEPQEEKQFELTFEVLPNKDAISSKIDSIKELSKH
ncbi:MAG: aldose 1-epimerase family protein [Promethearchaeota archaeon]